MLLALVMLVMLAMLQVEMLAMLAMLAMLQVVMLVKGVFRLELMELFPAGTPLSPGRLRRCRKRLWPVEVSVYLPRCYWPT